jgi:hypothetical protein
MSKYNESTKCTKLISTINIEELMSPIVLAHLIMVASLRKYQITG